VTRASSGVEVVVPARAHLGEGPVWDEHRDRLWWVDITAGRLHRSRRDGTDESVALDGDAGALALTAGGGAVVAVDSGLWRMRDLGEPLERLALLDISGQRFNDCHCDPAGRLWTGTLALDGSPGRGALYRVTADGAVDRVLEGVSVSNGIGFSPDGTTMYHVDSPTLRVVAREYDAAAGTLGRDRIMFEVAGGGGVPDGLAVDADGFVWLAVFGGAHVLRIAPDGELDRTIRLPVSHPTSCTFGGPDLDELYITSARRPLTAAELEGQPHAGAVLRIRPGVTGLPARRFADSAS
jgi:sugar lactone lactonase YvrE